MADTRRTWLVRRAEREYADRLGKLRHSELSWRIHWKLLPPLVLVGFIYGVVFQVTGKPSSSRDPELFSDVPSFVLISVLTGLVLWSLTLGWSFRRILVFDRGLLFGYARKHTARAVFWEDMDPASLRTVEAPEGTAADNLLKTLDRRHKKPLGVGGRYALVFHGTDTGLVPPSRDAEPEARFFTFGMDRSPEFLVASIRHAMGDSAVRPAAAAFPPLRISSDMRLDQP